MSDSRIESLSFNQLPLEILHGIFHYLDIPDILRIRRVSRYLNGISHSKDVWSDAYRKAKFVRPPGPFPSQSAHDLETALVSSFRVNRNLRKRGSAGQGERPTRKLREIRYTGVDIGVNLIFGRFLFVALSEEVRCYDLNLDASDSNSGASVIYRSTGGTLRSFHCVSAIDIEGRSFACAVLSEETQTATQISIHSLNVGEQSEVTLDLLHQFEHGAFVIKDISLGPRVIVIQGQLGPDPGADWRLVVLDVYTRTQFLLSSFTNATSEAPEVPEWRDNTDMTRPMSISTSTHLLLARSFYTQAAGWCTFVQAYALPPPHTHRCFTPTSTPLSPSHRGIIPGISVHNTVLLQDAILDPITQDVVIAIRVHAFDLYHPRLPTSKHGNLRLSAANTSHEHEVGTVAFQLLGSFGRLSGVPFLYHSFNGTSRVFYSIESGTFGFVSALEYDLHASGDIDGPEHAAKVTEYLWVLRFPTPRALPHYDPYSGRICFQFSMAKYSVIEILDLAV